MTGNDIVNRALVEIARSGSTILENGLTLSVELQDGLNRVIDDITVRHPFEFLIAATPDTVSTVANSAAALSLAANSIDVIDIVLDTGATDSRKLTKLPLRRFRNKWAAIAYLASGKPSEWCQINRSQFQVAPRPDAIYSLLVTTTKREAPITDFTLEVSTIPGEFHEALVLGLATLGAGKVQDLTRLPVLAGRFEAWIKKMIDDDRMQPDLEYQQQPFRAQGGAIQENYWATPDIRSIH